MFQELVTNPQVWGSLGLFVGVIAMALTTYKTIMLSRATCDVFWAGHFFLLDAVTGLAIAGANFVINIVGLKTMKQTTDMIFRISIAVIISAFILSNDPDMLQTAVLATVVATIFILKIKEPMWQKILIALAINPIWFVYHYNLESTVGMMTTIIFSTVALASAGFIYWRKVREKGQMSKTASSILAA